MRNLPPLPRLTPEEMVEIVQIIQQDCSEHPDHTVGAYLMALAGIVEQLILESHP